MRRRGIGPKPLDSPEGAHNPPFIVQIVTFNLGGSGTTPVAAFFTNPLAGTLAGSFVVLDLSCRLVAQVFPHIRQGEVDVTSLLRLDQFGRNEAQPVLAYVVLVDAQPLLNLRHLGWAVVFRHRQEESPIHV